MYKVATKKKLIKPIGKKKVAAVKKVVAKAIIKKVPAKKLAAKIIEALTVPKPKKNTARKIAEAVVERIVEIQTAERIEAAVEVAPELPKTVVKCMPCCECGRPIGPNELPVVLEWGKKQPGQPDFIGKPAKVVMCVDCDKIKNNRKPRAEKAESATTDKPKAASKGKPSTGASKPSAGKLVGKIYRIVKGNPRKEGTHGFNSYALITDGMTVEAYLAAGGRNNDLRWDIEKKFVEVK